MTLAKIQDTTAREVARSHLSCIRSFDLIGQHQSKRFYVTEIVLPLRFADLMRTGLDSRRHCFLSLCTFFFFFLFSLCFLILCFFLFTCFPYIHTVDPADHALGSMHILSLSSVFFLGKGISRALDLNIGQAYGQKIKTISCQDMTPPL